MEAPDDTHDGQEWELLKYPKITDGSQWVSVSGGKRAVFYVLEKVHGSCIALSCSSNSNIRIAKRTDWLRAGDGFHSTAAVQQQCSAAVQQLWRTLCSPGDVLFVYGELFGGHGEQAVQPDIDYGSTVRFVAFDVAVRTAGGAVTFIDYCRVLQLCKEANLPCLQPLMEGPLNKCMAYDVEFSSTIPAMFGLDIKVPAEGVVIKSAKELEVTDSRGAKGRAVAKRKAKQFLEVLSEVRTAVGNEQNVLRGFATRQRLMNVLSKMGKVTNRNAVAAKLKNELVEDCIVEAKMASDVLSAYIDKKPNEARNALVDECGKVVDSWVQETNKKK